MPAELWPKVEVSELIRSEVLALNDGYRVRNVELGPSGIPFVRGGDIGEGEITTDVEDHIRPEFSSRVQSKLTQPFDVAFISKGTVGRVGILRPGQPASVFAPQVCYWRSRDTEQLEPRFLFYLLRSAEFQANLHAVKTQGAMVADYVSLSDQRRFKLTLPPIRDQRFIATVLGALDDKIELNRRMNATLEAVARALFQSWFVDFDPVHAKLHGRPPANVDRTIAILFPNSFQDSSIGPVPKGWKVERFDSHITADRGLSYNGEGLRDDRSGLPMHNLNSIYEGGGYKHEGLKYYAGEYRDKHLLHPGDMIVTNTEQGFDHRLIGHAAIVPSCYGLTGLYSHHIYRVRPKPNTPFSPHYLVELFNNRRWHYWISGFSNGTTINMLPMDALEMPQLVVPPAKLVREFSAIAAAAHLQVENNKQQSRNLAELRDTLLPKLLSGELSIRDADDLVLQQV